jgi:hypothetical protein
MINADLPKQDAIAPEIAPRDIGSDQSKPTANRVWFPGDKSTEREAAIARAAPRGVVGNGRSVVIPSDGVSSVSQDASSRLFAPSTSFVA